MIRRSALLLIVALPVTGCGTAAVVGTAGGAVVGAGSTVVRGAVGAGRLTAQGVSAGVRQLSEPSGGFPAGTVVCLDDAGTAYAAATIDPDGRTVCPPPV